MKELTEKWFQKNPSTKLQPTGAHPIASIVLRVFKV